MLARVTRDLASKLGKKIALVQEGADIELNRQVLNLIRDPLIHLVRNAADHGLELPEVRQASGKSRVGQIRLRAFYDGDFVVIAIEDDGRGLDAEMIRRKAAEHRLATETELLAMSDRIVFRFVLLPGFSTLDEVTSISGRGVGLDVVRNNVEAIGGDVGIESWPNKGTSFSIRIPMHREIYPSLVPSGSNASASASEIIAVL
jgi:two-component system chemotaxis sensor kinase CheA